MYLPDNMSTEKMVPHPPLPPLFVTPYPEASGPCGNAPSPLVPVNVCRVVLMEVDPLTFSSYSVPYPVEPPLTVVPKSTTFGAAYPAATTPVGLTPSLELSNV